MSKKKRRKSNHVQKREKKSERIPVSQSLEFLKEGFSNYAALTSTDKSFNMVRLYFSQQTALVFEYISDRKSSLDLKVEVGEIISFMGGFYLGKTETDVEMDVPLTFAVSVLDDDGTQLMYAVSSHDATRHIMKGNSIEWIKNTHFEDTTGDHLLTRAKQKISMIESSLRKVIYAVLHQEKEDWITLLPPKMYKDALKSCRRAIGETEQTNPVILDYTYLPELKIAIENNWELFEELFNDQTEFLDNMTRLNLIRREESHNRKISKENVVELEEIYEFLLANVAIRFPEIVPQYLKEHWHTSLAKIVKRLSQGIPDVAESDRYNSDVTFAAMRTYLNNVTSACSEVDELIYPLDKKELHSKLLRLLQELRDVLVSLLDCGSRIDVKGMERAFETYKVKLSAVANFGKEYLFSEL